MTDVSEVDYSSPLYNQDGTEMLDYGTEMLYENGMYDTEMMNDNGMQNYVNGDMEDGSGYDGADDGDSADDAEYDDSDYDDSDYEDSDDSYDDSNDMEVGE